MKKNSLILILLIILINFIGTADSKKIISTRMDINGFLDSFHKAAAAADEHRYLGFMAEDGIFLGTAGRERWTKKQFARFVKPYFSKGEGWIYVPKDRVVHISKDKKFAWFFEKLFNKKYGELRGSGFLRKNKNSWKIVQYNMVFVIPNECSKSVVNSIKNCTKNIKRNQRSDS